MILKRINSTGEIDLQLLLSFLAINAMLLHEIMVTSEANVGFQNVTPLIVRYTILAIVPAIFLARAFVPRTHVRAVRWTATAAILLLVPLCVESCGIYIQKKLPSN